MKPLKIASLVALSLFTVATANADIASGISKSSKLSVSKPSAVHNGWFHKDEGGLPGIEVDGVTTKVTSFKSLTKITKNTQWLGRFGGVDKDGVVVLKMNNMPGWVPGFHNQLGNYAFKKVGNQEVYFGEWVARGADTSKARVVYYVGTDKTTNMPKAGKAVYAVTGINNNSELDRGVLKGEFVADFATNKLTGDISKAGLNVNVNATINRAEASFGGDATATTRRTETSGVANGHFFGKDASALAGYATFKDNRFDTAFGGTKK